MHSTPPVQIGKIGKMGIANSHFSVLSLSPALWLDAADELSINENAGSVWQWNDKSGRGNHAAQTTASEQPETKVRTLNGLNALEFNGVNSNIDLDHSALFSIPSGDNTIIIAWKTNVSGNQQRVLSGFKDGGTRWGILYEMSAGTITGVNSTSYNPVNNSQTNDTDPHIDFMRRSGSNVEIGRDGGTNITAEAKGGNVVIDNIRLGATLGVTSAVNGLIAEVLLFDRALSNFEMNRLGKYLSSKWGVTWTVL